MALVFFHLLIRILAPDPPKVNNEQVNSDHLPSGSRPLTLGDPRVRHKRERERERERETKTETETERQTETDRQTDRQGQREIERNRERDTDRQTDRQRRGGGGGEQFELKIFILQGL